MEFWVGVAAEEWAALTLVRLFPKPAELGRSMFSDGLEAESCRENAPRTNPTEVYIPSLYESIQYVLSEVLYEEATACSESLGG